MKSFFVPYVAAVAIMLAVVAEAFTTSGSSQSSLAVRVPDLLERSPLSSPSSCRETVSLSLRMPAFLRRLRLRRGGEESVGSDGDVAVMEPPEQTMEMSTTTAVAEEEEKAVTIPDDECEVPEELSETEKLMQQVKDAGIAGVISYALWELGFWTISVPVCVFGYREVTGHWPDFSDQEDLQKLGAEAFAFVNFARFAVPLRIGLALGTTPWIQENIVDRFLTKDEPEVCEPANGDAVNGDAADSS